MSNTMSQLTLRKRVKLMDIDILTIFIGMSLKGIVSQKFAMLLLVPLES
jgi:hypothetical protein